MDIRRLNHLVALADERNFGRAAESVHLSQPAFSRSVQAAEAEFGLQLFDRGAIEARCTAAGSFVVERARRLIFDSRCLTRDVRLFRERLIGDISFGVGPFPATTLLPALTVELRTRYPGIKTRVEVNNWMYLLEHLRAEEIDFFLADIRDLPANSDLLVTTLGEQYGQFYVRAGHPLLSQASVTPAMLLPYGFASVRLPDEVKQQLRQLLGLDAEAAIPIAVECDDVRLLKHIAIHSDTVLGSTDAAVRDEVQAGQLVALVLPGLPPMHTSIGIVSLKGRSFSPMVEFTVDFLQRYSAHISQAA